MSKVINNLLDYAEALAAPLRVLVVDPEQKSFDRVVNALAPYNAEVFNAACACLAAHCLKQLAPFDLIFIAVPLTQFGTPDLVIREIQRICPDASVVIMARDQSDASVLAIMEMGPFTFLKKNGDFDAEHIRQIARQLNIKLRPCGGKEQKTEIPQQQA